MSGGIQFGQIYGGAHNPYDEPGFRSMHTIRSSTAHVSNTGQLGISFGPPIDYIVARRPNGQLYTASQAVSFSSQKVICARCMNYELRTRKTNYRETHSCPSDGHERGLICSVCCRPM